MSERINDSFRFIIGCVIRTLGAVFTVMHRLRIRLVVYNQNRLTHEYKVSDQTPVRSYDNELEGLINSAGRRSTENSDFRSRQARQVLRSASYSRKGD